MPLSSQEKKLVDKIIKRDEKALWSFYQKYKKPVFNYIYRQVNDQYLAEEITQDVFFSFIENLRDFRGQCSLKTFLYSIVKHKVIDAIRKKKLKKILFSRLPEYVVEGLSTIILDDELERRELAIKIKETFIKLPKDYRLILRLKYIKGEKVKKIAQQLTMSFKATESLLFRARKAFIRIFNSLE